MIDLVDDWFTVEEIDSTTYAISEYGHWERVHSYLLLGDKRAALIDTGLGIDSMKRVTDQLTDLPVIVLTTHVHADHIGSHGEFEKIYVHKEDEEWLINGIKGLSIEQIRYDMARDITKPIPKTFRADTYKPYQGKPAGLAADGDIFDLGNRKLTIYHTPGHSPVHISIFDKREGYLFTGDLLYTETPIFAFYPSTNPTDLINSLEKIARINGVSKIYGGHNHLHIDSSILKEVLDAVHWLRENNLVKHGTGIHQFKSFSIQF